MGNFPKRGLNGNWSTKKLTELRFSSYDQWYITKKFESWYKIILGFASKVYIEIEHFLKFLQKAYIFYYVLYYTHLSTLNYF